MSESSEKQTNYGAILLTGVVALVVGVGSGWIINVITENRLSLEYELTSLEVFEGDQQQIGIVAIRVTNTGKREIEQLHCQVTLTDAKIREVRHEGLPEGTLETETDGNRLIVTSPFLNPTEAFAIQLLVEPVASRLAAPEIEMRGKGVVGHLRRATSPQRSDKPTIQILTAVLATMVTIPAMVTLLRRLRYTGLSVLGGSGEQRDDFAFLLELNGFVSQAKALRCMNNDQSYWALSDAFVASVLTLQDQSDAVRRGAQVLEQLMELHRIASSSTPIIRLNIARLKLAAGARPDAESIIFKEVKHGSKEVKARIALIPEIREIAAGVSRKGNAS